MIGYQVNNNLFSHGLRAFDHAARYSPHETTKFVFDDEFWSLQDWTKEPNQSWDDLLNIRAKQIRDKYGYLILMYSGGTDSHHIYEIFRRNNLKIDEILVVFGNTHTELDNGCPKDVVTWLLDQHWDTSTKITPVPKISKDLPLIQAKLRNHEHSYSNQPFVTSNASDFWFVERILQANERRRPGVVLGLEKPLLVYQKPSWYITHLDKTYRIWLPKSQHVEWFYIDKALPSLYIKQCFMLLNLAKSIRPNHAMYWNTHTWAADDYDNYCLACGRIGELFQGSSRFNKSWYSKSSDSLQSRWSSPGHKLYDIITDVCPEYFTMQQDISITNDMRAYMERHGLYHTSADWHGIFSAMIKIGNDD